MLLNDLILSKKGPLAKVWLSAHQEKKLSKASALGIDVEQTVQAILAQGYVARPPPVAQQDDEDDDAEAAGGQGGQLRMSGQLMLGVVRIYGRKAQYLMDDAKEVRDRITMAFRPGAVDLPADQLIAPKGAITLAEGTGRNEFDGLLGDFEDWDWNFAKGFEDLGGLDLGRNKYASSIRSASLARDSESGIDSRSLSGRADGGGGVDLGLDDGEDTLSSIEYGRDAQREREMSVLSFGGVAGKDGRRGRSSSFMRHGSVVPSVGAQGDLSFAGIDDFDMDLGGGGGGGNDGFDMDPAFEGGIDLGLDVGDPIEGLDLGGNGDRMRRESSRLSTPPPLDDQSDRMTAIGDLTPRTAARIAKLAEVKAARQAADAAGRPAKRVRLMAVVDDEIELQGNVGRRDVSHLLAPERYIPADNALVAHQKIQEDPVAFFMPEVKRGEQVFWMTTFEPMAPELQALFMVPAGGMKRSRPAVVQEGGNADDEDDVEVGRRQSRALSQRPFEMDDRTKDDIVGADGGFDDTFGDGGFDDVVPLEEPSQTLRHQRREGSMAPSAIGGSTVIDLGASGSDCPIAMFDTRPRGSNAATDSLSGSQFAAALEAEAANDVNEVRPAVQRKLGFSENTVKAVNVLREQIGEDRTTTVGFEQVSKSASRRAAASFFFELLVLGTKDQVRLNQKEAYGDIQVAGKPKLWQGVAA